MAFVNEFVPDEDVQRYGVADLWDHYRPYMLGKRAPGFRHDWTVDKERKEFLMLVDIGREEFSNRHTFVLYLDAMVVEARLDKGGSGSLIEPVLTSWELVQLKVPAASTLTRE